jgi:alkylation response protein AidB-like acyl-CoA dehydrogenase
MYFNLLREFCFKQYVRFRLMQACIDLTFDYVHSREQFNTKIGEFQLIQVRIR